MHALSFFTVSQIFPHQCEIMHTQHESTGHRLSRNKILIINSNDNTQSGHPENGLTLKCDYLESLCSRCKDVCDGTKFSRYSVFYPGFVFTK